LFKFNFRSYFMKKIDISIITILAMSSSVYAGGVFPEPSYVTEDVTMAQEIAVESAPQAEYVAPEPQVVYVDRPAPAPEPQIVYVDRPAPEKACPPCPSCPKPEVVYVDRPAPQEEYVAPQEEYVAPQEEYVAPQEEYIAPQEEYVAPQEEYVAPQEEYIAPQEEYVAPVIEQHAVVTPPPPPPPVAPQHIGANGLYAGIGLSAAKYDPNCNCKTSRGGTDKTAGVMGRIGYDFNKYVGIEARGIRTNWKSNGGKIKHGGIFLKPMIPVTNQTNVYGLLGYGKTKTEGKLRRVNSKNFAWGAGVEYDLSKDQAKAGRYSRDFDGKGDQEKGLGVFADYERLIQKSKSPNLDTVNVGVTYDF